MRLLALAIPTLATLLAGCGSVNPQPFTGPHGQPAYLMQCSGPNRSADACTRDAESLCPAGYTVVDRPTGVPGLQQMAGGSLLSADQVMAVECKRAA